MYGLPYQGSKNLIARELIQQMPRREYFVDLFSGGGAMWHAAMESGKYQRFLVNEYNALQCDFLRDCAAGVYDDCNEWVPRDAFLRDISKSKFLQCVWGFGNKEDYFCAYVMEDWQMALFQAIEHNDFSEFQKIGFEGERVTIKDIKRHTDWYRRRYQEYEFCDVDKVKDRIKEIKDIDFDITERFKNWHSSNPHKQLERLRNFHKQMDNFCAMNKTQFSARSYEDVQIPDDALVYCDPPYANTTTDGYGEYTFDHARFYDWVREQKELVLISEYNMQDDFIPIWRKNKSITLCGGAAKKATESLFVHRSQMPLLYKRNFGYQTQLFTYDDFA